MKKSNPVKVLLLAAALVLVLVCLTACSDNGALDALKKEKDELLAKVDTLTADASKAAEEACRKLGIEFEKVSRSEREGCITY